jgi:hypothetical protein
MNDFPGFKHEIGTEYQVKLNFSRMIVDSRNGKVIDNRSLGVACCGVLPKVQVSVDLSSQPPVPPFWNCGEERAEGERILVGTLKPLGPDKYIRLILTFHSSRVVVHICIVKANNTPVIDTASLKVALQDQVGALLNPLSTPSSRTLVEANSASTTAQETLEFGLAAGQELKSATVALGAVEVHFTAEDLGIH